MHYEEDSEGEDCMMILLVCFVCLLIVRKSSKLSIEKSANTLQKKGAKLVQDEDDYEEDCEGEDGVMILLVCVLCILENMSKLIVKNPQTKVG